MGYRTRCHDDPDFARRRGIISHRPARRTRGYWCRWHGSVAVLEHRASATATPNDPPVSARVLDAGPCAPSTVKRSVYEQGGAHAPEHPPHFDHTRWQSLSHTGPARRLRPATAGRAL